MMQKIRRIHPMSPKNEPMAITSIHKEVVSRNLSAALNIVADSPSEEKLGMMNSSTLLLPGKGLGRPHRRLKDVTARTNPSGPSRGNLEGGLILLTRCLPEQTEQTW
jgi:hypothetical protein